MPKKLKFGNIVLCEHVVVGQGSKVTLINVYAGDVQVSEFPAKLMFGLYAEYLAESTFEARRLSIEIALSGKKMARIDVEVKGGRPGVPAIITVPVFETGVDQAADIEVYATADGFGRSRIMRKHISLRPA